MDGISSGEEPVEGLEECTYTVITVARLASKHAGDAAHDGTGQASLRRTMR